MPVVINDFEVVTPTAQEQQEAKPGAGAAPAAGLEETVKAVDEHLRTRRERGERLHAS